MSYQKYGKGMYTLDKTVQIPVFLKIHKLLLIYSHI